MVLCFTFCIFETCCFLLLFPVVVLLLFFSLLFFLLHVTKGTYMTASFQHCFRGEGEFKMANIKQCYPQVEEVITRTVFNTFP